MCSQDGIAETLTKELKSLVQEDKITKIGSKNATQYLNKSL